MKVGIAGSPQSGKTTLFRLLTDAGLAASQSSIGVMEVPDQRVNILSGIYQPRKTTYARIDLVDIQAHKGQNYLMLCATLMFSLLSWDLSWAT